MAVVVMRYPRQNGWVYASNLEPGDELANGRGTITTVSFGANPNDPEEVSINYRQVGGRPFRAYFRSDERVRLCLYDRFGRPLEKAREAIY